MSNRSLWNPGTSHEPDNLPPRFRLEVDYYLLNDGSDEEAESAEESASQVLEDTSVADSTSDTSKGSRARPITEWLWAYFTVTELPDKQFINKRDIYQQYEDSSAKAWDYKWR
ncbi:hypothetical protein V1521DRAFT_390215 [Lipomyces starkeyi]